MNVFFDDVSVNSDSLDDYDLSSIDDLSLDDLEDVAEVSATDSLTVADTPATYTFDDTALIEKLDIIIMLLIVFIAIRMFSPLANTHKRILEKKEK